MAIDYHTIDDATWKGETLKDLRNIFEDSVDVASGTTRADKIKNIITSTDKTMLELLKLLMDSESQENASMQRAMMILPFIGDAKRMEEIKNEIENPTPL